ncbi:Chromosome partition protein Smc [Carpediemonas membranifera]|uniref:Chromosome partition protein Smc n=1 Tax=Carpediemonas membranifera TaxID=201153 RepID=A0A8J6ARD9_9EUKA|nr:Chromosome partition protein Smc [Carpediemonas membranifera]|eukprot:KAG9389490.1 Chromosome partition protein Smc [Carpediemonas membranifera]
MADGTQVTDAWPNLKALLDGSSADAAIRASAKDEYEAMRQKLKEAERERDIYYFQVREIEDEKNKIITSLQRSVSSETERRNALQERIDRVDRIESAIIDLYLEMRDRSTDNPDTTTDIEKDRLELRQKSPLVVLDMLRASLRVLLIFKEDFENELKDKLARRKDEVEQAKERLENRNKELVDALQAAREAQEAAERALTKEREAHELAMFRSQEVLTSIRADNAEISRLLAEKEQEMAENNTQLESKERIIGEKDLKLMRVSQLESQIVVNKMQNKFDLAKVQASHVNSLKKFEHEVKKFSKTEAELERANQEIVLLKQQIKSYRSNVRMQKIAEAEKKAEEATKQVSSMRDKITVMQKELRQAKFNADSAQKKMIDLKTEYDKLYRAVESQRKVDARRETRQRSKSVKESAESNPFYVEIYKNRLKEKEREVEEMAAKIRRLLAGQHRASMVHRAHETERRHLETELAEVRAKSAQSGSYLGRTTSRMANTMANDDVGRLIERNQELETQLQDYRNIKAVGVTTAKAYEQLIGETGSPRNRPRAASAMDVHRTPLQNAESYGSPGLSPNTIQAYTQGPMANSGAMGGSPGSAEFSPAPRPGSSLSGSRADFRGSRAARYGRGSARPMSAVTGRALVGVGQTHSTMRVGTLLE